MISTHFQTIKPECLIRRKGTKTEDNHTILFREKHDMHARRKFMRNQPRKQNLIAQARRQRLNAHTKRQMISTHFKTITSECLIRRNDTMTENNQNILFREKHLECQKTIHAQVKKANAVYTGQTTKIEHRSQMTTAEYPLLIHTN